MKGETNEKREERDRKRARRGGNEKEKKEIPEKGKRRQRNLCILGPGKKLQIFFF